MEPNTPDNPPAPPPPPAPPAPTPPPPPQKYVGSVFTLPPNNPLPDTFVQKVQQLEQLLQKEVWLLCLGDNIQILPFMADMLSELKHTLPSPDVDEAGIKTSRLALLIHSGGGNGEAAYRIACILKRRCAGFMAVVPKRAKSAATLLSLGADSILLGEEGDLGPIDAQFFDADIEEEYVSALDEVQAVEALEESATETAYRVMAYLRSKTKKSYNTLMKNSLDFAAALTKPLFEKIDSVRYSRQSRRLQEAQDYAERLLQPKYTVQQAKAIARDLVRNYPTHSFCIDRQESQRIGKISDTETTGLPIMKTVAPQVDALLDWFYHNIGSMIAMGKLEPVPSPPTSP